MKPAFEMICCLALSLAFAFPGWSQSNANQDSTHAQKTVQKKEKSKGPGKEMDQGGEDIGKGAAKGTADLGKGVAGGVGNLAKGNVGGAGASVGNTIVRPIRSEENPFEAYAGALEGAFPDGVREINAWVDEMRRDKRSRR